MGPLKMQFIRASGLKSDKFIPLHAIVDCQSQVIKQFKDKSNWLPAELKRRGAALVLEPTPRRLMSFLRACARHDNHAIITKKRQVKRDGRLTSAYEYILR